MSILSKLTGHRLPTVEVSAAHQRQPGVLLLDVREPAEWAEGHAPNAFHQPLGRLDPAQLPKVGAVLVICRSGNRSARATQALIDAGIDASNVSGGMNAWNAAGLPITRT